MFVLKIKILLKGCKNYVQICMKSGWLGVTDDEYANNGTEYRMLSNTLLLS